MLNEVRAGSATFAITPEHYQLEPAARYRDVTEDQAAVAFAKAYAGQIRFDHTRKSWFYWTGSHWKPDTDASVPALAQQFVRVLAGHADGKAKDAMGRVSFSERVERAATKDRALAADESKWDTDHFKLGTPDGTVDLKSGILAPSNSADMISKTTLWRRRGPRTARAGIASLTKRPAATPNLSGS